MSGDYIFVLTPYFPKSVEKLCWWIFLAILVNHRRDFWIPKFKLRLKKNLLPSWVLIGFLTYTRSHTFLVQVSQMPLHLFNFTVSWIKSVCWKLLKKIFLLTVWTLLDYNTAQSLQGMIWLIHNLWMRPWNWKSVPFPWGRLHTHACLLSLLSCTIDKRINLCFHCWFFISDSSWSSLKLLYSLPVFLTDRAIALYRNIRGARSWFGLFSIQTHFYKTSNHSGIPTIFQSYFS